MIARLVNQRGYGGSTITKPTITHVNTPGGTTQKVIVNARSATPQPRVIVRQAGLTSAGIPTLADEVRMR